MRTASVDKAEYVKLGHRVPKKLRDLLKVKSIEEGVNAEDLLSSYIARGLGRKDLDPTSASPAAKATA